MADNLVIVESPAKAKTIQKFLGKDYKVMSSYGHIRDLEKKDFSIDVENDFEPIYVIPEDKESLVADLRKASKSAKTVWLASDEDREGEAIAWHLSEVLNLKKDNTKRIVFHEITKPAILAAIENPREIDANLVDAQQARRVLDRIVGFELSPVLWKKIKPSLSAGRVQSVAVRLLAEREQEIRDFKSEQYFRVGSEMLTSTDGLVPCELNKRFSDRDEAIELLEHCKNASYKVVDIQVKPVKKCPAPPFTTSTLQQEAARKLGFSVAQTMRVAQSLYESGHITYMRTDSVNLSSLALGTISHEIKENLGEQYLKVRKYHTASKGAQEAHEAIRPTFISNHEISGSAQEKKLYKLIWKRTLASQMADAQLERTQVDINIAGRKELFVANGEVVKFDGFLKVYFETADDEENMSSEFHMLPPLAVGDVLTMKEMTATQRFTQQPNRYSEAMLVKRLEELGIGRPSTYAPTISTIQARDYVVKGESKGVKRSYEQITLKDGKISTKRKSELVGNEKGKLIPTDVGMVVNDFLTKYFPQILDYNFTAKVESEFDDIAEGKRKWNDEIKEFYDGFHKNIDEVSSLRLEHKVGERMLGTDPATGKPVSVKIGRYGPLVQMGSTDDKEKPRFASLQKDQSVATITLEEAIKLFDMPRELGNFEGSEVIVAIGKYGPYVKHDNKFVSIPKDQSPYSITLDEAVELINEKRENEAKKVLATFDEDPDMQVLNGRFGAYICYQKKNYKIPRKMDAAKLTLEDCRAIIADENNASKGGTRKRTVTRRKATTKK